MQASPYGLESLWLQGDMVTKGIAVLLNAMTIATWHVILTKALQVLRFRQAAAAAARQFWDSTSVEQGVATLGRAVAIPATFGYNALVRGNKFILAQLNKFGFELHALFITGERSIDTHTQGNGTKLTVVLVVCWFWVRCLFRLLSSFWFSFL